MPAIVFRTIFNLKWLIERKCKAEVVKNILYPQNQIYDQYPNPTLNIRFEKSHQTLENLNTLSLPKDHSYNLNIFCLQPIWSSWSLVRNRLTFFEGFKPCVDSHIINVYILSSFIRGYKTKSFCIVEPSDGPLRLMGDS